jgi:hypothetical protein
MVHAMAKPLSSLDVEGVGRLAELVGLKLHPDDADHVAAALAEHCLMIAPLFTLELECEPVAPVFDPRWRG